MAEVWRGTHRPTNTPVAIKIVTFASAPEETLWRSLFAREVRATARLDHPRIVRMHDHGEVPADHPVGPGAPFLVMEWVDGGTLAKTGGRRPWPHVRDELLALLDALAHAHARGVIHRDLKPANVLVAARGPVLTDFGIAAQTDLVEHEKALLGTPNYMAPEQVRADFGPIGPHTDMYALGCLAWYLITGRPPFKGGGPLEILRRQLTQAAPPLQASIDIPDGLEAWLQRLLAKRPEARFECAADAAAALVHLDGAGDTSSVMLPLADTRWAGADRAFMPHSWRADASEDDTPPPLAGAGCALVGLREPRMRGREAQRDRLWSALAAAHQGVRAVVIEGPSGCGKSRLASWLGRTAHATGAALHVHARHTVDRSADNGLEAALAAALYCGGLPGPRRLARIAAALDLPVEDEQVRALAAATTIAGRLTDPSAPLVMGSQIERRVAVLDGLVRLARHRPVVLQIDDVQWGLDAIEIVARLLVENPDAPILAVMTAPDGRRDLRVDTALAQLVSDARVTAIRLSGLPSNEMADMVRAILPITDALMERIDRAAVGSPLHAETMLRHWIKVGALQAGPDGFDLDREGLAALPPDLDGVWEARLVAAADPESMPAYELAAVLGDVVAQGIWRSACTRAAVRIKPKIFERMQDAGLIRAGDVWLEFAHSALRSALLRRADSGGRLTRWHAIAAAALTGAHADPRIIAEHLRSAGQPAKAAQLLESAIRPTLDRLDFPLAHELLGELIRALRKQGATRSDPAWTRLRVLWAEHATGIADVRRGRDWALRALKVARNASSATTLAHCLLAAGDAVRRIDGHKSGWVWFWEALDLVDRIDDPALKAQIHTRAGWCQAKLGHFKEAEHELTEALQLCPRRSDKGLIRYYLGAVAFDRGQLGRAESYAMQSVADFRATGSRYGLTHPTNLLGDIYLELGDLDRAEAQHRESLRLVEATGGIDRHVAQANLGLVALARGELDAARTILLNSIGAATQTGHHTAAENIRSALVRCEALRQDWAAVATGLGQLRQAYGTTFTAYAGSAADLYQIAEAAEAARQTDIAEYAWTFAAEQYDALGRKAESADVRAAWALAVVARPE